MCAKRVGELRLRAGCRARAGLASALQHRNIGHYDGNADSMVFPCQQYYHTTPATGGAANITAWLTAAKDDDNEHPVDRFMDSMDSSLGEGKPFLAVIWFHPVHIPCNDFDINFLPFLPFLPFPHSLPPMPSPRCRVCVVGATLFPASC